MKKNFKQNFSIQKKFFINFEIFLKAWIEFIDQWDPRSYLNLDSKAILLKKPIVVVKNFFGEKIAKKFFDFEKFSEEEKKIRNLIEEERVRREERLLREKLLRKERKQKLADERRKNEKLLKQFLGSSKNNKK